MGQEQLECGELTQTIIGCAMTVHTALGPGLLESAYEACLFHELVKSGLGCMRQVELPIEYDSVRIESGYRLDLVVESSVLLELKSIEKTQPIHEAQLMTYLRLSGLPVGLLINFNVKRLKDGIIRRAMSQRNTSASLRVPPR